MVPDPLQPTSFEFLLGTGPQVDCLKVQILAMASKTKASEQLEAKVKALGKLPENRACVNCGSKVHTFELWDRPSPGSVQQFLVDYMHCTARHGGPQLSNSC